ncbi:hypothetical protein HFN_1837 [Helicobacter fennelliae MRY12-0050]|uniref:Uncharacterized protein n=1 Tax=Helicobacter fennelliae MRY12-0050 TaxID=1325130 RepID=T1CN73_9HELI|nr:hypothetical protein HFN_1837 [Helicobacter fennelliae MRY12-0050]
MCVAKITQDETKQSNLQKEAKRGFRFYTITKNHHKKQK